MGGPQWQGDYIQNIINNGIHVHGDNNTVVRQDGQGDRNIMTQSKSRYIILPIIELTLSLSSHEFTFPTRHSWRCA